MAKLYLIRRNLESFAGPLTLTEMKEAYKRMQFGLQDEVSGHCGPWVAFDALEKIKKTYPEVARIVHEDMLTGWGVSAMEERIGGGETKRLDTRPSRGVGLALAFLFIALLAFAAAVYMATTNKLSSKALGGDSGIKIEDAQGFLDRGDSAGFQTFMQQHEDDVVDRIVRSAKAEPQWLPYARLYAFTNDGQLHGLDPKVLRGNVIAQTPVDCSVKAWRHRWRTSIKTWPELIGQRKIVHDHWARILAWDPYWVKRRDNKGWIGTQNYYVGCLNMASRALADISSDASLVTTAADWDKYGLTKVRQRLSWVLDVARGVPATASPVASDDPLSLWTCYEGAKDLAALNKCQSGTGPEHDELASYNDERYGWALYRLATNVKGNLPDGLFQPLTAQLSKMNREDHVTRFDYRAEMKVLKTALKAPGTPLDKAVEKTQSEFPDVKLSH